MGISPDIIITRSEESIDDSIKRKIALFCNVKPDCVIENLTLPTLYEAPIMLHKNGFDKVVCRELGLETKEPDLTSWLEMLDRIKNRDKTVKIAIVGKYVRLRDAYLSVVESLSHAGYESGAIVDIKWIESEDVNESTVDEMLSDCSGILVPGGFGDRGIEGKIRACQYAREHDVPYFGICLGMQIAVIEFARHVCKISDANSREFCENGQNLVIDFMPDQYSNIPKGGTMRLGSYPCKIKADSIMEQSYQKNFISERHRHRYEFNNVFKDRMEAAGFRVSGTSPDGNIVETMEIPEKSFFVGVQFHPEFKSRPNRAHPLFLSFVKASIQRGITENQKTAE